MTVRYIKRAIPRLGGDNFSPPPCLLSALSMLSACWTATQISTLYASDPSSGAFAVCLRHDAALSDGYCRRPCRRALPPEVCHPNLLCLPFPLVGTLDKRFVRSVRHTRAFGLCRHTFHCAYGGLHHQRHQPDRRHRWSASGLSSVALLVFTFLFISKGLWSYAMLSAGTFGVLVPFLIQCVRQCGACPQDFFMGDTGANLGLYPQFPCHKVQPAQHGYHALHRRRLSHRFQHYDYSGVRCGACRPGPHPRVDTALSSRTRTISIINCWR